LFRVNPATLGRLSRKVFLGRFVSGRGFSPDGSRLALTREGATVWIAGGWQSRPDLRQVAQS
jgi:hypothetical protein